MMGPRVGLAPSVRHMRGTGYNVSLPFEVWELMKHRRQQLFALQQKARSDDERAELERELAELDADIARGVKHYEAMHEGEVEKMAAALRERIEAHRD